MLDPDFSWIELLKRVRFFSHKARWDVQAVSAIDQVVKWTQELPGWQADAIQRLLERGELTANDRDLIYQMLKVDAGIESECVEPKFPVVGSFY